MIDEFYNPFKQDVQKTIDTAERISGERNLGTDPLTGQPVIARMGRYGPMVQIGRTEGEEKPRFAKLKANQSIETINLDEAFELFRLPRTLGQYKDNDVVVNIGRFGPYIKYGEDFVSLPKGVEPLEVDLEQAIGYINQKQEADAPIASYDGMPVTKGKGRFGPFIKWNDLYINVPRAYNFDALSQKDIDELIEKKQTKEANRFIQNWPGEKIAIENGRWGPFIRFGKKMLKPPYKGKGEKYTPEELATINIDEAKKWIEQQVPGAFDKKKAAKKAAPKKTAAKKAAPKKAAQKKK
jgi:DNA topoisomerase-1